VTAVSSAIRLPAASTVVQDMEKNSVKWKYLQYLSSHSGAAADSSIVGCDTVLLSISWCFNGLYSLPLQGEAFKKELWLYFGCLGLNMKVLWSLETSETIFPMTVHHYRSCEYSRRVPYYLWGKENISSFNT